MFKLALLCAVAAAAVDTEAPVINMDLVSSMSCTRVSTKDVCEETCDATTAGNPDCQQPTISAFDHHDGNLTSAIEYKTTLPNGTTDEFKKMTASDNQAFNEINFGVCGKYTVTLKVEDDAGNLAREQDDEDSISINVEDTTPPVITWDDDVAQDASCVCPGDAGALTPGGFAANPYVDYAAPTCEDDFFGATSLTSVSGDVELCPRANSDYTEFKSSRNYTLSTICSDEASTCGGLELPNNTVSKSKIVTVEDTTPPQCVMTPLDGVTDGVTTVVSECGYDYSWCAGGSDTATNCELKCEDAVSQPCPTAQGTFDLITIAKKFTFDNKTISDTAHTITYTPTDDAGNVGEELTRKITVKDTQAPVLTATDSGTDSANTATDECKGQACSTHKICHANEKCAEIMITCSDHCEGSIVPNSTDFEHQPYLGTSHLLHNNASSSATWNSTNPVAGRYIKNYTCTDTSNNTESRTVIYDVYPRGVPTLTLLSNSIEQNTWQASTTGAYTDSGATAKDGLTNADYTHLIRTNGDIVNLAAVGEYKITYSVTNPHTHGDDKKTGKEVRTVIVEDTTRPLCGCGTYTGDCDDVTIEAGFPYADTAAICSDSLDGNLTVRVENLDLIYQASNGTTSHTRESVCNGLSDGVEFDVPSEHTIGTGNTSVNVMCYKGSTFVENPATIPAAGHLPNYEASCARVDGLSEVSASELEALTDENTIWPGKIYDQFHTRVSTKHFETHFPCKVTIGGTSHIVFLKNKEDISLRTHTTPHTATNPGIYLVTYTATDSSNMTSVDRIRTVKIQDTLPPVITLGDGLNHLVAKGKLINSNPAWHVNPFALMAEQTPVNGWMVGAIASLVAGIALVSYSSKSESYSVPV